jgi:hypothetical protein
VANCSSALFAANGNLKVNFKILSHPGYKALDDMNKNNNSDDDDNSKNHHKKNKLLIVVESNQLH